METRNVTLTLDKAKELKAKLEAEKDKEDTTSEE